MPERMQMETDLDGNVTEYYQHAFSMQNIWEGLLPVPSELGRGRGMPQSKASLMRNFSRYFLQFI